MEGGGCEQDLISNRSHCIEPDPSDLLVRKCFVRKRQMYVFSEFCPNDTLRTTYTRAGRAEQVVTTKTARSAETNAMTLPINHPML